MFKILKYCFFDLIRSRWTLIYTAFYFIFTLSLFWLSNDLSKVTISLMNIVLVLVPLIATMFSIMYYYNLREFIELLLAQPIKRTAIFLGQYFGIAGSLSLSLLLGIGLPFAIYGIFNSGVFWNISTVLLVGLALSFIFSALAFLIALKNENRIRGFGIGILFWLLLAVLYDGLFLFLLATFSDYPIENFAVGASLFNPIDLGRILILLKLDISALMGFTGAVFQKLLGNRMGMLLSFGILGLWIFLPILGIKRVARRKDF